MINPETTLWFDKEANNFTSALPLGNGRLGIMTYGGVHEECIVINEESMWSGSRNDDCRENAHQTLSQIRELLFAEKNCEAQELVMQNFTCKGAGSGLGNGANVPYGAYQIMGKLLFKNLHNDNQVKNYSRVLELEDATTTIFYEKENIIYKREAFVSKESQIAGIKFSSNSEKSINFSLELNREERAKVIACDNELILTGQLNDGFDGKNGVHFCCRVRAVLDGGTLESTGERLTISNANSVIIYIAGETNYNGVLKRKRLINNPLKMTKNVIDNAQKQGYDALLNNHISEYQTFFQRLKFNLKSDTKNSFLPTDKRLIKFIKNPSEIKLCSLYFNFGRYLLISSSREGDLPANLQGIWCDEIQPAWNCDWHLNINVQMNYWLAEICNLSELHLPLIKLIESQKTSGEKTAKAYYNASGWVSHVITNCWGFTAPGEHASWGSSMVGGGWLCEHIWTHYLFTKDLDFLRENYYLLRSSAEFYANILVKNPNNGYLVTAPSSSPENSFVAPNGGHVAICMGPTMDIQIIRELFSNTIKASELLNLDDDFCEDLKIKLPQLSPNKIGPDGRLQEWLEPYEETHLQHRHVSHLYGLHPFSEISPRSTPALAEASRQTLEVRGDQSTGWSMAWKINFWARLFDGNRAYKLLKDLLHPSSYGNDILKEIGHEGGTSKNLFCQHPPFQIDGNLGATAAIAEMLLQSNWSGNLSDRVEITLLPALPMDWESGKISGLKAQGDIEVNLEWEKGQLIAASLLSKENNSCIIIYNNCKLEIVLKANKLEKIK